MSVSFGKIGKIKDNAIFTCNKDKNDLICKYNIIVLPIKNLCIAYFHVLLRKRNIATIMIDMAHSYNDLDLGAVSHVVITITLCRDKDKQVYAICL